MKLTKQDFARGQTMLDNAAKVRKLTPGEAQGDALVKAGLAQKLYRPMGSQDERAWRKKRPPEGKPYEYAIRGRPNAGGNMTRFGQALMETVMPSTRLATELAPKRGAPLVAMRSPEGVQYVEPQHAAVVAKRGWHHRITTSRAAVVREGLEGGMMFRRLGKYWEPTGRRACGRFAKLADKRVLHLDPSGNPWRWITGIGWSCLG